MQNVSVMQYEADLDDVDRCCDVFVKWAFGGGLNGRTELGSSAASGWAGFQPLSISGAGSPYPHSGCTCSC